MSILLSVSLEQTDKKLHTSIHQNLTSNNGFVMTLRNTHWHNLRMQCKWVHSAPASYKCSDVVVVSSVLLCYGVSSRLVLCLSSCAIKEKKGKKSLLAVSSVSLKVFLHVLGCLHVLSTLF